MSIAHPRDRRRSAVRRLLPLLLAATATPDASVAQDIVYQPVESAGFRVRLDLGSAFGDEHSTFHRVTDVAFHASSNTVWILEPDRIRQFSVDGEFLQQIGREGSGPGEFLLAASVFVDTLVTIHDARSARTSQFTLEGALVGTETGSATAGEQFPLRDGRRLDITAARFSYGPHEGDPYQHAVLRDGSAADTLASAEAGLVRWHQRGQPASWTVGSAGLGSLGAFDVVGDSILVHADGETGDVRWICLSRAPMICGQGSIGLTASALDAADLQEIRSRAAAQSGLPVGVIELTEYPRFASVSSVRHRFE